MNQVEKILQSKANLAVVGLNEESFQLAAAWSQKVSVKLYDNRWGSQSNAQLVVNEIYAPVSASVSQAKILKSPEEWQDCGLFYFSGLSSFSSDWEDLKLSVITVAQHMPEHSWIVFGPDIDADLVEVVLVELIERHSSYRLSEGFHVAFSPHAIQKRNLENLGNEIKMSHNLIINALDPLFSNYTKGQSESNQISYQREDRELRMLEEQVKKVWVPALNQMNSETFSELVRASYQSDFLEPYKYLRLSTEWRVNVDRFFNFALRNGLKSYFQAIIEAKGLKASFQAPRFMTQQAQKRSTYSLF